MTYTGDSSVIGAAVKQDAAALYKRPGA